MSINIIRDFEYHVPGSVQEAAEILSRYDDVRVIAGGTDVIPKMKAGIWQPAHLMSLKGLKELKSMSYNDKEGLTFGARCTLRELEAFEPVRKHYAALWEGMRSIANTQVRNAATPVGNIVNAVPSADTAPAMLVLDARLRVVSSRGERILPVDELFVGVCRTSLAPDELVTEVMIPPLTEGTGTMYCKYSVRKALDLAMIGSAARITVRGGVCTDARIGLGAVAATPVRARNAEKILIGQKLTDELIAKAALTASEQDCMPITDIRATKEYRREMVRVITRDVIKEAVVC